MENRKNTAAPALLAQGFPSILFPEQERETQISYIHFMYSVLLRPLGMIEST